MRVLYEEVKKQIANAVIGSQVEVLVSNGTRRNGSSPYYRRTGKLVDKTETSIKVLISGRNYNMRLWRAITWVDGEKIETEYANGLFNVTMVAE